jgi:nitrate reductase cytochrome c-type subunit
MWKRLQVLNPEEEIRLRRESFFGPTGRYQLYVGNDECVDCHKKDDMHPDHVKRWSNTKFKTFERIQKEPDYQAGDDDYKKQCYKCHTTGYREDKGIYAAEGVGCEACHGPGEVYAYLMQGVRDEEYDIEQGQKLAKISFDFSICGNCHIPKRHEMREEFLKEKAKEEAAAKEAAAKEAAAAKEEG